MDTEKLEKELEKILIEIPECSRCVLEDGDCRILTITDCRILKLAALFPAWAKDKGMVELDEDQKTPQVTEGPNMYGELCAQADMLKANFRKVKP